MRYKKILGSIAALALSVSAAAAFSVTASAEETIDEVIFGTLSADGATVEAETFDDLDTAAVQAKWATNGTAFSVGDGVPTDVWNGLALHMSGNTMRINSRQVMDLNFANPVTNGKVVFAADFYVGTHAKKIQFISTDDKVVAEFSFPDKSPNNSRIYGTPYIVADAYAPVFTGGYKMNDTSQGTRNREYHIAEFVVDTISNTITYSGSIMDRRSSANKWCDDSATATYSSNIDIKGIRIDASVVGNADYTAYLDNVKLYTIKNDVATYDYSVVYKCNGETVKTVNASAPADTEITADGNFWENGKKYYITAAVAPTMTVGTDASTNVLEVDVREANTYTSKITGKYGDKVKELVSDTIVEGENYSYRIPRYIQDGTSVYEVEALSGVKYGENLTAVTENIEKEYVYTLKYENVVEFQDFDESKDGKVSEVDNASNGACRNGSIYTSTTLEPGDYTIITALCNRDRLTKLVIGEKVLVDFNTEVKRQAWETKTIDFTVTEESVITMTMGENKTAYDPIDTVVIVKKATPAVEVVSVAPTGVTEVPTPADTQELTLAGTTDKTTYADLKGDKTLTTFYIKVDSVAEGAALPVVTLSNGDKLEGTQATAIANCFIYQYLGEEGVKAVSASYNDKTWTAAE